MKVNKTTNNEPAVTDMRRNFVWLLICLFLFDLGLNLQAICAEERRLEGKKVLMIIAKKDFRDEELKEKEAFDIEDERIGIKLDHF